MNGVLDGQVRVALTLPVRTAAACWPSWSRPRGPTRRRCWPS